MSNNRIPTVEIEFSGGSKEVTLVSRHLKERRVFITGEINSGMANDFMSEMIYLETESDEPVTIYINSPGGEVNAGLLIYDIIRDSNLEINLICTGLAASMAAIILAGGEKGHRYILNHSKVMIHEPKLVGNVGGSATSVKSLSESILEVRNTTNGILAEQTGKSIEEINEATLFDNYMNAEEAVEFGICDRIIDKIVL